MMSREELPELPRDWHWREIDDVRWHWRADSEYPFTSVYVGTSGVIVNRFEKQLPVPLSVILAVAKANGVSL